MEPMPRDKNNKHIMKKYFLYGIGAVMGLALTACDGYKEPNPPAQYNPQETVLKASDVNVEGKLTSQIYDLGTLIADKEDIQLAEISCSVLPEGYGMNGMAFVSADNFETSYPVATTVKEGLPGNWNVAVVPENLQTVYNDNISTEEVETTLKVRFHVVTVLDSQVAIVGGEDNWYGPYDLKFMPTEPAKLEMPGPFLWTPGSSNGWNQEASQQLYTLDGGNTFIGFALIQDEFKFTDAPNWDGTNFGAGQEEGTLSTDGEAGNIKVDVSGLYYCKVDVENLTYELTLISTVGAIGDFNGWGEQAPLTTTNDLVWTGDIDFGDGGGFKFRMNDDWGINLGGDSYKYLISDGANLNAPAGMCTVTLDLSSLPYSCTVVAK